MKFARSFSIFLLALAMWPAFAGQVQPAAVKILPIAKDAGLKGWKAVPDAQQYAKGKDLTDIYDGGYERYLEAGVLDAARNLYQRGPDIVEVTVHTMKSKKTAETFFDTEIKANKANRIRFSLPGMRGAAAQPKHEMAIAYSQEQSLGYAYAGKYYITVTSMYGGAKARNEIGGFLETILKKAAKPK
ncbi:MAG: hypothetical protein Q7T82_14630 [Armatimonadota bacterium]|nr:hypothetical protein [Armatimonadota bacterium]